MAQNFTDSPSNGDTQSFNGVVYTYNSTKNSWSAKTAGGIALTDLSVGSEPSASGNGDVSFNNSTGVITYTPPVLSSGGTTTVYNTASLLPLSGNSEGDMAFAKDNNRFYVWNGSGWYSVALVNASPTISSGVSSAVTLSSSGVATVVTITASDPEGTSLTYGYSVTSGSLTNGGGASATVVQGTGASTNVFTVTPTTTEAYGGSFSLTFTATDGVSTATSTGAFTLTFASPQHFSTALKVKTSGTNARTNSLFDDASTSNHTITPTGEVFQTSLTPHSYNWSNYFDGNDSLIVADSPDYDFGTGDFTLEAWIYPTVTGGTHNYLFGGYSSSGAAYGLYKGTGNDLQFYDGSSLPTTTNTMSLNEWSHIAVSRTSGSVKMFINGELGNTTSMATSLAASGDFTVGLDSVNTGFIGYLSNIHVVKGTGLYTASFKPSVSPITLHSNTKLLTCSSNRFVDESTSPQAITTTGDAEVSLKNPFTVSDRWKPTKGGSAFFDGSDFVQASHASNFNPANSDWTAEMWLYRTGTGTVQFSDGAIFSTATPTNTHGVLLTERNNVFGIVLGAGSGWLHNLTTSVGVHLNRWQHIALVREGTNVKLYSNGVLGATVAVSTTAFTSTNQNMNVGGQAAPYGQYYKGYIADFNWVLGTAKYTGNFTPPTGVVSNHSNTKLKLNFTQAGVFDSISKSPLQLIGNTQESTTQTKYATTSMKFDGTGDYIKHTGAIIPTLAEAEWQLEFWVYPASGDTDAYFISQGNSSGAGRFCVGIESGAWSVFVGTPNTQIGGSLTPTYNQWQHVVVLHNKTHFKWFLDGVEKGSAEHGVAIQSGDFFIGDLGWALGSYAVTGYIEDVKVLNNHTTYPNERPQTALTAVSGTTLQLANASSIPSSPNGLSLSVGSGSPTVSSFTPTDSTVTHSIRYDGNDRTDIAANTNLQFGTGDFTVEMYLYIVSQATSYASIVDFRSSSLRNNASAFALVYDSSKLYIYAHPTFHVNSLPRVLKKWQHLVYQRRTISGTSYDEFYIDGVLFHQATDSTNWTGNSMWIGSSYWGDHGDFYISDLRVNKGTAIYSSSFTPPSSAL